MSTIARDRTVDLSAAVARYQQVLAADPDQWDALYLYGTALLQLGRLREAIDVFTRAARLRPDIPDIQNNLAVAYQGLGAVDAAVRAYRSAIDLNPDFDLAHANLARLLESAGRFAEAEISLLRPADQARGIGLPPAAGSRAPAAQQRRRSDRGAARRAPAAASLPRRDDRSGRRTGATGATRRSGRRLSHSTRRATRIRRSRL